jgi:hypothetical protein
LVRNLLPWLQALALAAVFAQHEEVMGSVWVAAHVCACERVFSLAQPLLRTDQHREGERAFGIAVVVGAAIRRFGTRDVTTVLEQDAEVVRGAGVAALICA